MAVRTGGRRKETKLQEEEQEGGAGRRRHGEPETGNIRSNAAYVWKTYESKHLAGVLP